MHPGAEAEQGIITMNFFFGGAGLLVGPGNFTIWCASGIAARRFWAAAAIAAGLGAAETADVPAAREAAWLATTEPAKTPRAVVKTTSARR